VLAAQEGTGGAEFVRVAEATGGVFGDALEADFFAADSSLLSCASYL